MELRTTSNEAENSNKSKPMLAVRFKKGDVFKTPSGKIKIISIARQTKNHGEGYRISNQIIIEFDEFHKNVKKKLWFKNDR